MPALERASPLNEANNFRALTIPGGDAGDFIPNKLCQNKLTQNVKISWQNNQDALCSWQNDLVATYFAKQNESIQVCLEVLSQLESELSNLEAPVFVCPKGRKKTICKKGTRGVGC